MSEKRSFSEQYSYYFLFGWVSAVVFKVLIYLVQKLFAVNFGR